MSAGLAGVTSLWRRRFVEPEYPLLAIEVRPQAIAVAHLQRDRRTLTLKAAALQELPAGTLAISVSQPNIVAPEAFAAALRIALERAGALGASRACLVLPDPVGRLALVSCEDLAGQRRAEVDELLRFKLRRTLPFDVREAQVAHAPIPARNDGSLLPVAVVARPVLEQYESALVAQGVHAGVVELAGWVCFDAALRARRAEDRLVIQWDAGYVTLLLARNGRAVLARTLTGESGTRGSEVAREVFNTVLYYRERLGGSGLSGATVCAGSTTPDEAVAILREPLGFDAEVLNPWGSLAAGSLPSASLSAGVTLALAALLRSAA
jgi:type IV pilus assembly protein PilM